MPTPRRGPVRQPAARVGQDWFIRRDGSFVPVAYSSAPVTSWRRRGAVVAFRDISDRNAPRPSGRGPTRSMRREPDCGGGPGRAPPPGPRPARRSPAAPYQHHLRAAGGRSDRRRRDHAARGRRGAGLEETQLAVRDLGAGLDPSVLAHRGLAAAITSLTARTPVPVALVHQRRHLLLARGQRLGGSRGVRRPRRDVAIQELLGRTADRHGMSLTQCACSGSCAIASRTCSISPATCTSRSPAPAG